jgi:putative transposase
VARYRKITNQRKDFHHKRARVLAARYYLPVVEDLMIANMLDRAKPVPAGPAPHIAIKWNPGEDRTRPKHQ